MSPGEVVLAVIASIVFFSTFTVHAACGVFLYRFRKQSVIASRPKLFLWLVYWVQFIMLAFYYTQVFLREDFPCLVGLFVRGLALPALVFGIILGSFRYYCLFIMVSLTVANESSSTSGTDTDELPTRKRRVGSRLFRVCKWYIGHGQLLVFLIIWGIFVLSTIMQAILSATQGFDLCSPSTAAFVYGPIGLLCVVSVIILAILLRKTHDGLWIKKEYGFLGLCLLFTVIPAIFFNAALRLDVVGNSLFLLAHVGITVICFLIIALKARRSSLTTKTHSSSEEVTSEMSVLKQDFNHDGFKNNMKVAKLLGNTKVTAAFGDYLVHYQQAGVARCFSCWKEIYAKFKRETSSSRRLGYAAIVQQKFLEKDGYMELPKGVLSESKMDTLSQTIKDIMENFSADVEPEVDEDLFDELLENLENVIEPFVISFMRNESYKKKFGVSDAIEANLSHV